ncbi:tripartite tricarboxylate transporter permease [uncultured Dysosmobacter sp.]|uniref:tripartite tricarboxylate transporter permease n=1 Tax=uncultured Dysosmobacter sp. TaxID=2591384 RepID=UPI002625554A|nr:tripartite tricarboxylate transporter permease [uncultured Dysosmobacter sp.]
MENFALLFQGMGIALQPYNILMAIFGGIMGILVGAMPGIGSLLGCALLLPLTFKMNATSAIIMLAAIYYGNMYGGAFSAILLNIPGDSPAIMTALDGYPLTKKGRPGAALFTANMASFFGGTIGILILTFLGTALADIGLMFGPSEMVAVMVLSLSSISYLLGDSPRKGMIATMLGIMLATVGIDNTTGLPRYTFGNISLLSGIQLVPLVIGVFGFSQVMQLFSQKETDTSELKGKRLRLKDAIITKKEAKECAPSIARSGVVGTIVGILPGSGATISAFLCYIMNKKLSKRGEEFGTGIPEGVAASEASNNAAAAGAFAPLLALGIPGSGTAAVLLSGLMMWGLTPGPQLFTEQSDFCWGLISSMYVGNVLCLLIAMLAIPMLVKLISVPSKLISPVVVVLCFIGAFAASNEMTNIYVMLLGGVIGYFMNKYEYPTSPMLLAFVLSPTIEKNLYRSFQVNGGSASLFWTKPITIVLLLVTIALMVAPQIVKRVKGRQKKV